MNLDLLMVQQIKQMKTIENSNYIRLLGIWKTSGKIFADNEIMELSGTDKYEFIMNENFILQKADVTMSNENSETMEIISVDASNNSKAKMKYFNSNGETGVMTSEIINNDFTIDDIGIKFNGSINKQNSLIVGKWFLQTENQDWKKFIELQLEKIN